MTECESGRENACRIGIREKSTKKQGVGVVQREMNRGVIFVVKPTV